jgi:Tol biopolymer transport system component
MGRLNRALVFVAVPALVIAGGSVALAADTPELVSVNSAGERGEGRSTGGDISPDGRYVVFESSAANLVSDDSNGSHDVFLRDRTSGTTERVNVASSGQQADSGSENLPGPVSADGRYVVFTSTAANLVPGDTNGSYDAFVRDRFAGTTERVSLTDGGGQVAGDSVAADISADGRYVVFESRAGVVGGSDGSLQIYVRDRFAGTTQRVSVNSFGQPADDSSGAAVISADGRCVAFTSRAGNLSPDDANGREFDDVFVYDRVDQTLIMASINDNLESGDSHSGSPSISADCGLVSFDSTADNLVPGSASGIRQVFVHDVPNGQTSLVSWADPTRGSGVRYASRFPSMSADGRYVAFIATHPDVFGRPVDELYVRDRFTGENIAGLVGDNPSGAHLSGNGRLVAFTWRDDVWLVSNPL